MSSPDTNRLKVKELKVKISEVSAKISELVKQNKTNVSLILKTIDLCARCENSVRLPFFFIILKSLVVSTQLNNNQTIREVLQHFLFFMV